MIDRTECLRELVLEFVNTATLKFRDPFTGEIMHTYRTAMICFNTMLDTYLKELE